MPITKILPIKQLKLDLSNFRTVPQESETDAIHAMISINPEWFWALTESLLDDPAILLLHLTLHRYLINVWQRYVLIHVDFSAIMCLHFLKFC